MKRLAFCSHTLSVDKKEYEPLLNDEGTQSITALVNKILEGDDKFVVLIVPTSNEEGLKDTIINLKQQDINLSINYVYLNETDNILKSATASKSVLIKCYDSSYNYKEQRFLSYDEIFYYQIEEDFNIKLITKNNFDISTLKGQETLMPIYDENGVCVGSVNINF